MTIGEHPDVSRRELRRIDRVGDRGPRRRDRHSLLLERLRDRGPAGGGLDRRGELRARCGHGLTVGQRHRRRARRRFGVLAGSASGRPRRTPAGRRRIPGRVSSRRLHVAAAAIASRQREAAGHAEPGCRRAVLLPRRSGNARHRRRTSASAPAAAASRCRVASPTIVVQAVRRRSGSSRVPLRRTEFGRRRAGAARAAGAGRASAARVGLERVVQRCPGGHQRRLRRVVQARVGDHGPDVPELADQEPLEIPRPGRGVQVRSRCHRASVSCCSVFSASRPRSGLQMRVEDRRDHLQVELSVRRILMCQSGFRAADGVGRVAFLVVGADRVVRRRPSRHCPDMVRDSSQVRCGADNSPVWTAATAPAGVRRRSAPAARPAQPLSRGRASRACDTTAAISRCLATRNL